MDNNNQIHLSGIFANGYGIIPKLVMQNKNISIEAKAIYAYICSYSGKGTNAFPKINKILSDLSISKDRFYKHIKQLVKYNFLEITKSSKKGRYISNIYTIVLIPSAKLPCPYFTDTDFTDTENKDNNNNNSINNNNPIFLNNNNNINKEEKNNFYSNPSLSSIAY